MTAARRFAEQTSDAQVTNVLSRLDSVVDRLEGVYDHLVPLLERQTGRRPVEMTAYRNSDLTEADEADDAEQSEEVDQGGGNQTASPRSAP